MHSWELEGAFVDLVFPVEVHWIGLESHQQELEDVWQGQWTSDVVYSSH